MTQSTFPSPNLRLNLTPMQMARAAPTGQSADIHASVATDSGFPDPQQLVLYPGEPSEMVVQIENLGQRTIALSLQIEGNFPLNWCRIGLEGNQLLPRQRMEAVLYFQVPLKYFEEQRIFTEGDYLNLDYQCRIFVDYTETETGRRAIESSDFSLYVRPHSLYLNFLPALYREVDFISRLLTLFEQAYEPAVEALDLMWAHLDPLTAPQALLPFIAYWVAWTPEPLWSEAKQRQLIRQAIELYRWRGTRRGLRLYLHIYTDLPLDEDVPDEANKHIGIEEVFGQGFVLGGTTIGRDSIMGGGRPFHFIVHLRPDLGVEIDETLVRYIIEQEKPAFCTYELHIALNSSSG